MELRKLALGVVPLVMLGIVGCGESSPPPPDPCDPPQLCTNIGSGTTYKFVINRSSLSISDGVSGVAQGFDLDCKVTPGGGDICDDYHADFNSCDPTMPITCPAPTVGIDNQLAALIPVAEALVGTLGVNDGNCDLVVNAFDILQTTINALNLVLLLEVTGVADPLNDECVGLRLTIQAPPASPGTGDCDQQFGAGLAFVEDPAFVDVEATGAIVNGRLKIRASNIPLSLPLMGSTLSLNIDNASIEGDFTQITPTTATITNGIIGGGISRQQMIDLVGTFLPSGDGGLAVTQIVDSLTDLNPVSGICQGMSMGITFSAVDATF